jgi:hypothetical protein
MPIRFFLWDTASPPNMGYGVTPTKGYGVTPKIPILYGIRRHSHLFNIIFIGGIFPQQG